MRKVQKTYGKPSNSYRGKIRKPWMVNHEIPVRKDEKNYGKPSNSNEKRSEKPLVNNQIPMREDEETT